jgi:hypothetical protein
MKKMKRQYHVRITTFNEFTMHAFVDPNLLDVLFILVSAKINLFFPNCMSE